MGIYLLNKLRQNQYNNIGGDPDPILVDIVGAWAFEVNSTISDLVGSVDGTVQGATTLETGANGNAIGVSSANNTWIDFGNPAAFDQLSAITVFIDWYPTLAGEGGTSNIFGNYYSQTGAHSWHLGFNSSRQIRGRITDSVGLKDIISTNAYALDTWHRVALRWEGDGYPPKIEINGVDEYIDSVNCGAMRAAGEGMQVSMDTAYSGASTRQITGYVDNAFVWDRYLSDAEMAQMFTNNPTYAELANGS